MVSVGPGGEGVPHSGAQLARHATRKLQATTLTGCTVTMSAIYVLNHHLRLLLLLLLLLQGHPPQEGSPYVPRGSWRGVAMVRCRGRRLFLAPEPGSPAQPTIWPSGNTNSSSSSDREGPGATA